MLNYLQALVVLILDSRPSLRPKRFVPRASFLTDREKGAPPACALRLIDVVARRDEIIGCELHPYVIVRGDILDNTTGGSSLGRYG